ncbi:MAG: serine/threonine-protein kinase [Acidobacteriota bacterium]
MHRIGRYEIREEIGRGAMGVVYLAHDPQVRRAIALKTYHLPAGLPPREEKAFRARFLREAQTAGALSHPAIVTIYDAGEDPGSGTPFIAMEHVPGSSLREFLEQYGPLPLDHAARLFSDLASGLQAAHAAGIVHRDMKPANILVRDGDGAAKITDFGIARLATSELTRTGQPLGSPAYMSPEQIRGLKVDGRSDLFSLAVIFYEALCGSRPFAGSDLSSLAYSIVHETPLPISRRAGNLPAALDRFFDRALAKRPGERFQDGLAFGKELGRALTPPRRRAPTSGPGAGEATLPDSPPLLEPLRPALGIFPGWAVACRRGLARLQAAAARLATRLERSSSRERTALAGAVLLILMLGGGLLWEISHRSYLMVEARSRLEGGTFTVLVDGAPVLTRELAGRPNGVKAFGRSFQWGAEEFQEAIPVRPGRREVTVQVAEEDGTLLEENATVEVEAGTRRLLEVTVEHKKRRAPLRLKVGRDG